jgi:hypothetical protein
MILCYLYFLATNRDFGYEQHFSSLAQKQRRLLIRRKHFDEARYLFLKQELQRWQRYSKSLMRGRV